MSLLKKKTEAPKTDERGELTTEAAVIEKQRVETRAYQKEHRQKHLARWNEEKAKIDSKNDPKLSGAALSKYLEDNKEFEHETRVGLHSMKVNPYEYAMIKQAMRETESRSSRELFIKLIKALNGYDIDSK